MHQQQEQKALRKKMAKIEPSKGPTFYMFCVVLAIIVGCTSAYLAGLLSTPYAWLILVFAYYFVAMCVHDAIHLSAHKHSILNRLAGWGGSLLLGMTFHAIRRSHLQHHASLGHDHDSEAFLYRSALSLPFRLVVANFYCYLSLRSGSRWQKFQGFALLSGILLAVALKPVWVLLAWIFPMQIAVALFALNTVYMPHGPLASWLHNRAPALTGFHLHHHSMPQLPWYQLFQTARKMRMDEATRHALTRVRSGKANC